MVFWRLERAVEELCFPLSELSLSLGLSLRPEIIHPPLLPSSTPCFLPHFCVGLFYPLAFCSITHYGRLY